jgi:hypothetical protein
MYVCALLPCHAHCAGVLLLEQQLGGALLDGTKVVSWLHWKDTAFHDPDFYVKAADPHKLLCVEF